MIIVIAFVLVVQIYLKVYKWKTQRIGIEKKFFNRIYKQVNHESTDIDSDIGENTIYNLVKEQMDMIGTRKEGKSFKT